MLESVIFTILPPPLVFILGSFLIPLFNKRNKSLYMLILPVVAFFALVFTSSGNHCIVDLLNYKLTLGRVDGLSKAFGFIFIIITFISILFALQEDDNVQYIAAFCYAGGALGVTFAGDFFSLYIFWEIMAVASTFLILARKTEQAYRASYRYVLVHIVGGLFLLAGIVLYYHNTGTLDFSYIGLDGLESYFIFIGIALNAAIPPLHPWLQDAYPEATVPGAVFLSAFTTKSAVYLMARTFPGTELLIWLGAIMTALPIFYAVLENDIRRVLAYSLINQVGFMMCGIGIGTALAINGTVSHAFCHILYKALLFMSAGSVLYMTGKIKCTEIGGLYKTMPLTCIFCMIGAASISAFPLFSGFVSKSMIVSAAGHHKLVFVWLILQFASAGVFHHAGIKVPFFTFFGHDSGLRPSEPPWNMLTAMGIAAFLCVFLGIYPQPLYAILPYPVDYVPYTASHVVSQLQLLMFGALAFALLILSGYYPPEIRAINLDLDWFYRKGGKAAFQAFDRGLNALNAVAEKALRAVLAFFARFFQDAAGRIALFFLVNFWLLTGMSAKRLEIKKASVYYDIRQGTLPVGVGAVVAVLFIILIYYWS